MTEKLPKKSIDAALRRAYLVQQIAYRLRGEYIADMRKLKTILQNNLLLTDLLTPNRMIKRIDFMRDSVDGIFKSLNKKIVKELTELVKLEASFALKELKSQSAIDVSFKMPSANQITSAVTTEAVVNLPLSKELSAFNVDMKEKMEGIIRRGYASGQTTRDIVNQIKGTRSTSGYLSDKAARDIETIVRTGTNRLANAARQMVFDSNEDIIEGDVWVATLDDRVCPECLSFDGEITEEVPPLHPNCRCVKIARLKPQYQIDFKDATRASQDGPISAKITGNDWLKTQSKDMQNIILGKERADIFRRAPDKFSLDTFRDKYGNLITLDRLRELEPEMFR